LFSEAGILERLPGIKKNRNRAFVDQLHLHRFLKTPGFTTKTGGPDLLDEILVEFACLLRRGGGGALSAGSSLPN